MADLLGEVDVNIPSRLPPKTVKTVKTANRRKTRVLSPPISHDMKVSLPNLANVDHAATLLNTPPLDPVHGDDVDYMGGMAEDDFPPSDPVPSSPTTNAVDRKSQHQFKVEEDDEDMMEIAQVIGDHKVKSERVNISGSRPIHKPSKPPAYPSPASSSPTRPPAEVVDASAWNDVTSKLNVLSSQETHTTTSGKLKIEDATEDDGSLRFFWTDYTEVNGSLCLFGKVKNRNSGAFVSAFVKIDSILRKLYFLPRTYRQKHGRDTSTEVGMDDVYEEVDEIMTKLRVGMHKIKPCSRKYAFELQDIPKEADYLKLMYPYDSELKCSTASLALTYFVEPPLPAEMKGDTFSHVFGTTTALFEQFVLWKSIMGPCWLNIDGAAMSQMNNASWCKCELQVASPKAITVLKESDAQDAPPLTFMSIALRTTWNVKENKQEILVASARVYEDLSLTETRNAEDLPCKTYTIMRPVGASFPTGFDALCKKQRGTIMLEKTENMLLSRFLALLERADPDVLLGHQLQDVDYPVLLSRFREKKTPGWHRIGRLRRSDWPKNMGKGGTSFFAERQLVSGRLLCDVANDMGRVCFCTVCFTRSAKISLVIDDQVPILDTDRDVRNLLGRGESTPRNRQ